LLRNKLYAVSDPQEKRLINLHIATLQSDYIESRIDSLELEKLIERTYALLPEKIRKTFIMSRKEGLSYEEIAQKTGITVKSVEYQISVALKVFRRKLKGYLSIF
jgi:RNA polymerase sigma-70 factor (ECF subfamily)